VQKLILILVILLVAVGAQAQTKSRTKTTRSTSASLSIEAAVIYESGDVKPVARSKFVILDEDLNMLLKPFPRLGGNYEKTDPVTAFCLKLEIESMQFYAEDAGSPHAMTKERAAEVIAEVEQIQKTIAAHTVASVITDFSGKAKFEGLAPGRRFIYGTFTAGSNQLSWHMVVEIKSGTNATLTLSNDNALAH
jgi:hypothetical protein